ncbi:hypothetical protein Egran_04936 [Elaphomyces granulatus]|uniref:Uncharacterized protein n=1 Tax=Elaphomyces granulatus TaxID=519963 RepID=A0A232LT40_9EURO|nr:hypothetical protein Egran_04936 [Elaphomyces granulatus]
MPSKELTFEELKTAVHILVNVLTQHGIVFGIMGGAGVALLASYHGQLLRSTSDIDLVVETDAYSVSQTLISQHSGLFGKMKGDEEVLVDVEIFDYNTWRVRPSYDLANPQNVRISVPLGKISVTIFEPRWLLQEKIRVQYERAGSRKETTDLDDIAFLVKLVPTKSLVFREQEQIDSLQSLVEKRPELKSKLEEVIDCDQIFKISPASR